MYSSFFFFSSRRRHTRFDCDWSSDVCSSDLRLEWAEEPAVERKNQRSSADGNEDMRPDQTSEHDHQTGRNDERLHGAVRNDDAQVVRSFSFLRVDARAFVVKLLAFPKWISRGHVWNLREVVFRRRAGDRPLQSADAPGVRTRDLTALPALEKVADE